MPEANFLGSAGIYLIFFFIMCRDQHFSKVFNIKHTDCLCLQSRFQIHTSPFLFYPINKATDCKTNSLSLKEEKLLFFFNHRQLVRGNSSRGGSERKKLKNEDERTERWDKIIFFPVRLLKGAR